MATQEPNDPATRESLLTLRIRALVGEKAEQTRLAASWRKRAEQAEAHARRYRFLRDGQGWPVVVCEKTLASLRGKALDEAIDAAYRADAKADKF